METNFENKASDYPQALSFASILYINEQMRKCVCKVSSKRREDGTGFFCKIPFSNSINLLPVLITSNLIIDEEYLVKGKEIMFSLNDEKEEYVINIEDSRKIYKQDEKDGMIFIEIKPSDGLDIDSFLEIDKNVFENNIENIYKNQSVYLIHYPNENAELSVGIIKSVNSENYKIEHYCMTGEGSFGSPIIKYDDILENCKVIGIHRGTDKLNIINIGTLIKGPIEEFNKKGPFKIKETKEIKYISIIYKIIGNKKIKLFGREFVEKNRGKCKMIINGEERGKM